jgi:hypothetical protein
VAWPPRHLRNWSKPSTIFGDFSTASQTADRRRRPGISNRIAAALDGEAAAEVAGLADN